MYYLKVGLSLFFIFGTFASLIYSVVLLIHFLQKRSNKRETMKKTFLVSFGGTLCIFLTALLWQIELLGIEQLISSITISCLISFILAVSFAGSYWHVKE